MGCAIGLVRIPQILRDVPTSLSRNQFAYFVESESPMASAFRGLPISAFRFQHSLTRQPDVCAA
jgi:hypothetical protein